MQPRVMQRQSEPPARAMPSYPLLRLQQTIGNRAVGRLLRAGAIQAKLKIGQPNDRYEQEADRVADAVLRIPEPGIQLKPARPFEKTPSRRDKDIEEELIQPKPIVKEITPLIQRQAGAEEIFQAKQDPSYTSAVVPKLESRIQALRGRGQPLSESERTFFEPRFGCDFDRVRIHTGVQAAEITSAMYSRAFTAGRDIMLGAGQYAPGTMAGRRLLAHELTHTVQQARHNISHLQRFAIDASCHSSETFPAEQQGNMQCQDGSTIPNGMVLTLSFATLPNRCRSDRYNLHSATLIERALRRAIAVVSSPGRPEHCLQEEEFQRGVLNILRNTTIRCERDRGGSASASILSNIVHLRHGDIHGDSPYAIEALASTILHEALHIWEGRFGPWQHTGIVTPCTAACFPRSGQAMVNTNPRDCVMPPLIRGTSLTLGPQVEATRGGGLGAVLSFRRHLFSALRGHLSGQLGVDVSYEHLFSAEAQRRYGSDVLRITPLAGLTYRPGILDRKGLVFNLDIGPSAEIGQTGTRPGLRFNLGTGLEFDFLQFGAGMGIIVPLSDSAQTILDFTVQAGVSF